MFVLHISIFRSYRKSGDNVGAVARLSNRLHKIKGVLRGPVEGHTFDSDPGIDLVDSEYVRGKFEITKKTH